MVQKKEIIRREMLYEVGLERIGALMKGEYQFYAETSLVEKKDTLL